MTSTSAKRPARSRAFSLVEVLLAGVLLALFGAALASSVGQAADARARSAADRAAAEALEDVLTRVDLLGPRRLEREGPTEGELAIGGMPWAWGLEITQRPASDLFEVKATARPGGETTGAERVAHTLLMDPVGWRDASYRWEDLD
ncbi:hypothetical protein [Phycisphaera mikurensis]|uniref:General secretion pathway protein I n=1 Tax=Phycisphaera mikurensis (strain NBRC 102666 / KCTC 22515 / FYK2301M01) TaxID=1142394 RepID=I0IE68_PHYMF|nr:hypothetical protein [Phycisphaera mikurensis]MBB6441358.1 type II secretory pathway pseudopilin PulG [Phycisphaera mikurensis]BAM03556.1 hypothetical protein PSMK_13970 [Phycisphaera mikurensis NBRC 102666]